ncbi:DUF4870 domain-containing protein [Luedemannella helvata]
MTEPPLNPPPPPPPGPGLPPAGYANNDEKTWALVAHFGGAAGALIGTGCAGWIAPLIALLAKGNESPAVRQHAVAALNFQILVSIVGIIGWITTCILIGFVIWLAAMAVGIIFGVLAGLKANEGQFYKYPISVPLVK